MSAREGANGGGSVREDGLSTVYRDGVVTERCLVGRGGAGGNRGTGPIKGIIGTANGVADGKAVCKITQYEQRGDHQAAGTGGLGPRGRQGRSRQVQAPRQARPRGGAAPAQGPRAGHLAQYFPAGGLGVGLKCCIPCTCTPATSATPTA